MQRSSRLSTAVAAYSHTTEVLSVIHNSKINRQKLLRVKASLSKERSISKLYKSKVMELEEETAEEVTRLKDAHLNAIESVIQKHDKELDLVKACAKEKIKRVLDYTIERRRISSKIHKEGMDSIKSVKHQISDVMKNNRTDMKKIKEKAQGQIAGIRINSIADMKRIREEANEEVRTQRLVARSCMNKNVTLQEENDRLIHQLDNRKKLKSLALSRARTS